jgi:hypothetical protein
LDIDYVEYSRCLLKTLQEEGARSPHNASYLGIFPIPNNIQRRLDVTHPRLTLGNKLLADTQLFVDLHGLFGFEDRAVVADQGFWSAMQTYC